MSKSEEITQQKLCLECGAPIIKQNAMDKREKYCHERCCDKSRYTREKKRHKERYHDKVLSEEAIADRNEKQKIANNWRRAVKKIPVVQRSLNDLHDKKAWDNIDNQKYLNNT